MIVMKRLVKYGFLVVLFLCMSLPSKSFVQIGESIRGRNHLRSSDVELSESPSIGFLGFGTIASAIGTGLLNNYPSLEMFITKRSEQKSSSFLKAFPHQASVYSHTQDIVDRSDLLFLTVLPEQVTDVLGSIKFDEKRHILVSLVSTSTLEELRLNSGLPETSIYKMICLPVVAFNEGVCLIQTSGQPVDDTLQRLLESLGGIVVSETEHQMESMMVISGLMGSFYGTLRQQRDWLVKSGGLNGKAATSLVLKLHNGMLYDALKRFDEDDALLDNLVEEQTPGGLNEQALANLEMLDTMENYDKIMDALFSRISGKSDGCLLA